MVTVSPLLETVNDWPRFLSRIDEDEADKLQRNERKGRALVGEEFLDFP